MNETADPTLAICNSILPLSDQHTITNISLLANANRFGDAERMREKVGYGKANLMDTDKITPSIVKGDN